MRYSPVAVLACAKVGLVRAVLLAGSSGPSRNISGLPWAQLAELPGADPLREEPLDSGYAYEQGPPAVRGQPYPASPPAYGPPSAAAQGQPYLPHPPSPPPYGPPAAAAQGQPYLPHPPSPPPYGPPAAAAQGQPYLPHPPSPPPYGPPAAAAQGQPYLPYPPSPPPYGPPAAAAQGQQYLAYPPSPPPYGPPAAAAQGQPYLPYPRPPAAAAQGQQYLANPLAYRPGQPYPPTSQSVYGYGPSGRGAQYSADPIAGPPGTEDPPEPVLAEPPALAEPPEPALSEPLHPDPLADPAFADPLRPDIEGGDGEAEWGEKVFQISPKAAETILLPFFWSTYNRTRPDCLEEMPDYYKEFMRTFEIRQGALFGYTRDQQAGYQALAHLSFAPKQKAVILENIATDFRYNPFADDYPMSDAGAALLRILMGRIRKHKIIVSKHFMYFCADEFQLNKAWFKPTFNTVFVAPAGKAPG